MPAEIGNLINLKELSLNNNKLNSLPAEIGNLLNLKELYLKSNKLSSLPAEIIQIKNILDINETSYEINNLDIECKILIFKSLHINITNLPINLEEIWLSKKKEHNLKLPLNCEIKYF